MSLRREKSLAAGRPRRIVTATDTVAYPGRILTKRRECRQALDNLEIAITAAANYSAAFLRQERGARPPCLPMKESMRHKPPRKFARPKTRRCFFSGQVTCRSVAVNLRGTAIGPHSRSVVREDQRPATRRQQRTHSFVVHALVAPAPTMSNNRLSGNNELIGGRKERMRERVANIARSGRG